MGSRTYNHSEATDKITMNPIESATFKHNFFIKQWRAQPRLFLSTVIGVIIYTALPQDWISEPVTRIIIGWNAAVCIYLALVAVMAWSATEEKIRYRARLENEGRFVILTLVILASVASFSAIVAELSAAKDMTGVGRYSHVGLAAFTILSSWAFVHTIFALHYAHDYFVSCVNGRKAGLAFPEEERPDYFDFLYFAFIIGTSAQTADVSITGRGMRRLSLVHCVLSFLFNTTILALTINIAASLL